jgi:hypothetical protein
LCLGYTAFGSRANRHLNYHHEGSHTPGRSSPQALTPSFSGAVRRGASLRPCRSDCGHGCANLRAQFCEEKPVNPTCQFPATSMHLLLLSRARQFLSLVTCRMLHMGGVNFHWALYPVIVPYNPVPLYAICFHYSSGWALVGSIHLWFDASCTKGNPLVFLIPWNFGWPIRMRGGLQHLAVQLGY